MFDDPKPEDSLSIEPEQFGRLLGGINQLNEAISKHQRTIKDTTEMQKSDTDLWEVVADCGDLVVTGLLSPETKFIFNGKFICMTVGVFNQLNSCFGKLDRAIRKHCAEKIPSTNTDKELEAIREKVFQKIFLNIDGVVRQHKPAITKDDLERFHDACKMIEYDADQAYRTCREKYGAEVAGVLLVMFLRRSYDSALQFPEPNNLRDKVNEHLHKLGLA
jgi:hypothetical protein